MPHGSKRWIVAIDARLVRRLKRSRHRTSDDFLGPRSAFPRRSWRDCSECAGLPLDQAPLQWVDVCQGIDTTLLMMHHKIGNGVSVRRDYAEALPPVLANARELNLVWTSVIDNAAEALGGHGTITLRARCVGRELVDEATGPRCRPRSLDELQPHRRAAPWTDGDRIRAGMHEGDGRATAMKARDLKSSRAFGLPDDHFVGAVSSHWATPP